MNTKEKQAKYKLIYSSLVAASLLVYLKKKRKKVEL